MPTPTIRPARADDSTEIRRVGRESWHAAYDDVLGAGTVDETIDQWYVPERLRESISRPNHGFFVAERDELVRIYVVPDEWGTGLGTRLLHRAERRARELEAERLRLVVIADNDIGVGFYESRGFERIEDRGNAALGVREYVYEKEV